MFPSRYFPVRYFDGNYWPPGAEEVEPPVVAAAAVGGHFLPEYEGKRKYRNLRREAQASVRQALRELRGEVDRVEETAGIALTVPVAAELRDRLAGILADETDYLTPIEAARQLVLQLIAEQNIRDEEEAMFIIMGLGA